MVGVWLLIRAYADEHAADRGTLMLAVFPGSFVLSLVYSEGLVLTFVAFGLLALMRKRWLLAGVLGMLATATTPIALAFEVSCLWCAYREVTRDRNWRSLAAPILTPLGFLSYQVWLWVHTGNVSAWRLTERGGWKSYPSLVYAAHTVGVFLKDPIATNKTDDLLFVCTVLTVIAAVIAIRARLPIPMLLYGLVAAGIAFVSAPVGLRPRFIFLAFPLIVAVGHTVAGPGLYLGGGHLGCAADIRHRVRGELVGRLSVRGLGPSERGSGRARPEGPPGSPPMPGATTTVAPPGKIVESEPAGPPGPTETEPPDPSGTLGHLTPSSQVEPERRGANGDGDGDGDGDGGGIAQEQRTTALDYLGTTISVGTPERAAWSLVWLGVIIGGLGFWGSWSSWPPAAVTRPARGPGRHWRVGRVVGRPEPALAGPPARSLGLGGGVDTRPAGGRHPPPPVLQHRFRGIQPSRGAPAAARAEPVHLDHGVGRSSSTAPGGQLDLHDQRRVREPRVLPGGVVPVAVVGADVGLQPRRGRLDGPLRLADHRRAHLRPPARFAALARVPHPDRADLRRHLRIGRYRRLVPALHGPGRVAVGSLCARPRCRLGAVDEPSRSRGWPARSSRRRGSASPSSSSG